MLTWELVDAALHQKQEMLAAQIYSHVISPKFPNREMPCSCPGVAARGTSEQVLYEI
jgi:hypothetical protein